MAEKSAPRSYRIYVLGLFALVYFFYLVDRSAIIVSQELIKREFDLSDTTMGLMTGTLYGVAYALAGVPLGWAVDRMDRRNLLAVIVALWSGLTALSGLCATIWQLALARIGVGAAESGGGPAALSILSDLFPPHRRGMVSSIFYAGAGLGSIVSFLVGGYVAQHYGWRAVFIAFGLPGMLLALLVLLTVREPVRQEPIERVMRPAANPLRETWSVLRHPGLGSLYFATGIYMLSVVGVSTWSVPFFTRSFDIDLTTVGLIMGIGAGLFAVIGQLMAGFLFDWARRFGPRGPLMVVAIGSVIHIAAVLTVLLSGNLSITIAALCIMGATTSVNAGPTNAAISQLAPSGSKGTSFALYAVISNVVGSGLGPVLVGFLSDWFGDNADSLRNSMIIVALLQILAVAAFVRAGRIFAEVEAVNEQDRGKPVL